MGHKPVKGGWGLGTGGRALRSGQQPQARQLLLQWQWPLLDCRQMGQINRRY